MGFSIITAKKEMSEKIAHVHIKTWQHAYKGIVPQSFLDSMTEENRAEKYKFENELEKGHFFFAVKIDNYIAGFLYLCRCRDDDSKDAGEIGGIYLLPEYQHKGYGAKMMEYAIDFLRDKGHNTIKIWVLEQNEKAISFYNKFGFSFDGSKKEAELGKKLTVVRFAKTFI